ncbi:DUF1214 domain-containing protein [Hoeflea sp. WL0058]|uniref:DUF1214 domain-containing protein n=1 Tax=Flavimaribacter sediminis TaxID=2865987 RepID=A0AAE3CZR7_9HYPH|nr:DUF1214 domain-containing protein [Flavimaribacter sediminis]MBW8637670.1 DUF1214 domain-containing protein [Flavimaribacter sediminis]
MIRQILVTAAVFVAATAVAKSVEPVSLDTYARAESDEQMKGYIEKYDSFGKFGHFRELYDVDNQITIRGNRDTVYSVAVFDLTTPLTITMPETGDRFQSLLIVNEDHSIFPAIYEPGEYEFTEDEYGTRYIFAIVRTFVDPGSEGDLDKVHALQDAIEVSQASTGTLEMPDWDTDRMHAFRDALNVLASSVSDTSAFFGIRDEVERLNHMMGVACCWGANLPRDAIYLSYAPDKNDGNIPHQLTVKDVPVDGFWSVTLYDGKGFIPKSETGIYSYNNVTASPNDDGSFTINFGHCDDDRLNCLEIVEDWNYLVRLYRPEESVVDGNWKFPEAIPVH